jgi:hypothetical protein
MKEARTANSTYKKLAVQRLNEALCLVSSSVVADSFRLRNRQLLVAAKRCVPLRRTSIPRRTWDLTYGITRQEFRRMIVLIRLYRFAAQLLGQEKLIKAE